MKKLVKSMAALLIVAGVVGFMGCKQATGGDAEQNAKPGTDVTKPEENGGNENTPVEPEAKPLQEGVKVLPEGTDGTFGTKGVYVEFGYWPQSKKADSVKLGTKVKNINGWSCLIGTDGAYYVKATAKPHSTCESEFKTNSTYYFKLEPIQWRVLTNDYDGKKLLFAEKALAAGCFYNNMEGRKEGSKKIYPNNYKESDIRTYLNNDFINKAFTKADIEKIPATDVDNSWQSTFGTGEESRGYYKEHNYACENTTDKIFLLSEEEITTANYGFDAYGECGTTSTRIRKTTDYARATGARVGYGDYVNNSGFWLRSPIRNDSRYARYVSSDGDANRSDYVYDTEVGVVPALSISF